MTLGTAQDHPRLQDRLFHVLARRLAPSAAQAAQPVLFAVASPAVQGGDFIGPGGRFGVWGPPVRLRPSDRSQDQDLARQLWEVSEEMTGVHYTLPG
jgi:hypothetical protein